MTKPFPAIEQTARSASSIVLEGVSRYFGDQVAALDDVCIEVQAGEFFTLLGPSGCGKTTLLRLLAGLDQPDAGRILIGGRAMHGVPPHQRSVNTVFQSYALFPHRNVRENIAFGLQMQRRPAAEVAQRIAHIAELTGIAAMLERRVEQLSGGQRQRVALARALVNEPDVLLLDEPLSALDAGLRSRLQIELKRLQRQLGMTFVFVTHDQEEAMVMSDRIAVLNEGRIVQVGTPQAIYETPANVFVAQFMGHENLVPIHGRDNQGLDTGIGRIEGVSGMGSHLLLRPESLTLHSAPDSASNPLPVTVEECLYRGGVTEYRLHCNGYPLMASIANQGQTTYQAGQQLWLELALPATAILSDQGDG